ncbi:YheC/YheD family protein [Bacillus sp. DX4.1]|uniref:YheC/YheD family protein n=1 Tax=Bacillus sp. DX4.1 TaxID=3055867 RepID=UPI0025A2779A|nr:YheC/YheD family protein [Bacillus sp. DX4.1]MDM5191077.1 YheC/YheD family protein [Bacillus sp. DX4.1]
MGIPIINTQHCFDKWHVNQQLRQYEELRPHLPETRFCKNKKDLKQMFKQSSRVFLKSLSQNNGSGIMCVTMNSEGYGYTHFGKSSLKTATFKNFNDLFKAINLFYNGKPFIMQKAIDLIQLNDGTADIRSEIQRNGQGQLEYVAHYIRLGTENSPITNTRTQSTVYPFDDFFKNNMGYTDDETTKLKKQLGKLLLYIYEKIELSYGAFGEIGIDIGIDTKGHLWFIECNAKPGKTTLRVHDKETIDRFDDFFTNNMGYSDDKISELKGRLEKFLVNVYEKIESVYGRFGEIGIDIGIDTKGHLWFIECNAKPGKNSLWVQDEETIDRAFLNPLEYAKFITREKQQK